MKPKRLLFARPTRRPANSMISTIFELVRRRAGLAIAVAMVTGLALFAIVTDFLLSYYVARVGLGIGEIVRGMMGHY